ncbi:MAG TPA: hypothetical protein DD671_18965 [Balneolaceae bacterium]|nr:hypothetical protein [Balneolaceae bacterium]
MKILIIQENGRNDANRHMRECHSLAYWFEQLGAETACWGKGHDTFHIPFEQFQKDYDVIFCLENYDDGWLPDLSSIKKYKVFWSIDSHMELQNHLKFCQKSGINLHLNAQLPYIEHFKDFAEHHMWWPTAVDPRWFKPMDLSKDIEIGFVGSMIADRPQITKLLHQCVGLQSFTNVLGQEMVDLTNRFKIGFNKTISNDINMRTVETTACNVPLITNVTPGLEKMYNFDSDIMIYRSLKEMIGVCQWLTSDHAARQQIAQNGYKRTLRDHTYKNRCQQVYEHIKSI